SARGCAGRTWIQVCLARLIRRIALDDRLNTAQREAVEEDARSCAQHRGCLAVLARYAPGQRGARPQVMRAVDEVLRLQPQAVAPREVRRHLPVVLGIEFRVPLMRAGGRPVDRGLRELGRNATLVGRELQGVES